MAHLNLHLAEGLCVGGALGVLPLARAWLAGRPVAGAIARLALLSFGCALFAIGPQILRHLGASPSVHTATWANVFLGHAWLDRRFGERGLLIGELVVAAYLIGLYLLMLVAIYRARRRR